MKKIAVVALTSGGGKVAAKISEGFTADLFGKRGRCDNCDSDGLDGIAVFDSLSDWLKVAIYRYDAFVMVMATGIAVRIFAPYIVHKSVDPAVVVVDEGGGFAISLLSGHLGGANKLAREIAIYIGAQPVITTATDVNGQVAADVIAVELGLRIVNIERLKSVNAIIAEGQRAIFYLDSSLPKLAVYSAALEGQSVLFKVVAMIRLEEANLNFERGVLVTATAPSALSERLLVLSPGRLIAGIGCRRHVPEACIMDALRQACEAVSMDIADIDAIVSTVVKCDELGLLEVAANLGVPVDFYENEVIAAAIAKYHLPVSSFVEKQIGVGNVCEATALIRSHSKKLLLRKTKYPQVTVALAWER